MSRVVVTASPEEFTFVCGRTSVSVAPVVWYNPAGQISAFGLGQRLPPELRRLDLFPRDQPYGYVEPFFAPLHDFLSYHYEYVTRPPGTRSWRYMFPLSAHVVFAEVHGFDEPVAGDSQALLMRASRAAGARRTEFRAPAA